MLRLRLCRYLFPCAILIVLPAGSKRSDAQGQGSVPCGFVVESCSHEFLQNGSDVGWIWLTMFIYLINMPYFLSRTRCPEDILLIYSSIQSIILWTIDPMRYWCSAIAMFAFSVLATCRIAVLYGLKRILREIYSPLFLISEEVKNWKLGMLIEFAMSLWAIVILTIGPFHSIRIIGPWMSSAILFRWRHPDKLRYKTLNLEWLVFW
jgi:hypothetical protein